MTVYLTVFVHHKSLRSIFTSGHWRHMEIHVKNRQKNNNLELCKKENIYVKM